MYALQILYALENGSEDAPRQAVDAYRHHFGTEVEGDVLDFARTLVSRVSDNQHKVDDLITGCSKNWRLERMAKIDKSILRLAASELLFGEDVPVKVVINEAVELAKTFGAHESAAFVNGILDKVAQEARH